MNTNMGNRLLFWYDSHRCVVNKQYCQWSYHLTPLGCKSWSWLLIASGWQQIMGSKVRIQIEFYLDPHFCTNNPLHTHRQRHPQQWSIQISGFVIWHHCDANNDTVHCIRMATGHGCKSADPDRILSGSAERYIATFFIATFNPVKHQLGFAFIPPRIQIKFYLDSRGGCFANPKLHLSIHTNTNLGFRVYLPANPDKILSGFAVGCFETFNFRILIRTNHPLVFCVLSSRESR